MSRAARRHQRLRQKQQHVRQSRARTTTLRLDERWVEQVDRLSNRIRANVRDCETITEAAAQLLGVSDEDAAELLERYFDETHGEHPQGLLGWLATSPVGIEVGIDTPNGIDYVPLGKPGHSPSDGPRGEHPERPLPQLTVTVEYPPGSTALAEAGAIVTVPLSVGEHDEIGRTKLDLRLEPKAEDLTDENARALLSTTLEYLRMTWPHHSAVLETITRSRLTPLDDQVTNAPGGAA